MGYIMNDKSIVNIVNKIIKVDIINIERIKYEDYDGYYNVWKINTVSDSYILKQSKDAEVNNYKRIQSDCLPKLFGCAKYYNKIYILIEYISGIDLTKSSRDNIIKTLDSLIEIQTKYWDSNDVFELTFEEKVQKVIKRKEYLYDETLELAYEKFIHVFLSCKKTFIHDDLLPFNVIINKEKSKLIDLEYIGILPYPLSFCRLITHCKEEKDYIFYMSDDDKKFAINYYYENFIKNYFINYEQYIKAIKYFMFYEFTEWVFVYNKYNSVKDQRYEYYYFNSKKLAKEILEGLYD